MDQVQQKYTDPTVATDTVLLTIKNDEVHVLLMKMDQDPYKGYWAAPGYLLEIGLTLKENAKKYLKEMGGVEKVRFIDQISAFGKPGRDPLGPVISITYLALIPYEELVIKAGKWEVKLFPLSDLPKLAYDHDELVKTALKRLESRLTYSNIAFTLLQNEFTLAEAQKVYEIVLKIPFDKRNFRKKMMKLNLVKKTGEKRRGLAHRPAELYTTTSNDYKMIPRRLLFKE